MPTPPKQKSKSRRTVARSQKKSVQVMPQNNESPRPPVGRLFTLSSGGFDIVRGFPNTFKELEAMARDWIKPPRKAPLGLRIPVEHLPDQVRRLLPGHYLDLTGERSFGMAQASLNLGASLKVEIVSDTSPPEDPIRQWDTLYSYSPSLAAAVVGNPVYDNAILKALTSSSLSHGVTMGSRNSSTSSLDSSSTSSSSSSPVSSADKNSDAELTPIQDLALDTSDSSFASLCDWFTAVLADQSKYKTLLAFQDERAQKMLDATQKLLDDPRLENLHLRKDLLSALVRLSRNALLYPKCYTLKGIRRENEAVASGHFGEIWKGEFEGRKVCLKMVKIFQKSSMEQLLKAFCKEAIVWKHLSHPNVLPFYGIYHLEDLRHRVCLVSPWMENGNVTDFLERNPNAARRFLISDILEGISYLHDENIVHGDIKGVNAVVTESGRACLADFGLSSVALDADILKWTSVKTTAHGIGTVRWQAEELFDPENEDTRPTKASDIYSFSCTCYEIFTGHVPFYEVQQEIQVILKVMRGGRPSRPSPSPENLLYHERGMTSTMWELMEACWHSDPAMRPTAKQALLQLPFDRTGRDYIQRDSDTPSSFEFLSTTRIPVHISAAEAAEIMSLIS